MSKNKAFNFICWIFIIAFLMITVFPFFWILISSFKPESEIFGANCYRIIAENPTFDNYKIVVLEKGMLRAISNSFLMSALTTIYVVVVASMSAYIISRFKFKGKNILMGLILVVAMFPQMIIIGPIFNMFYKLDILNSYWVCLAYSTITLPSAVWIMVAHFNQVPLALEEAAHIDGAGPFRTYFSIVFPLLKAPTATLVILYVLSLWNDYLLPSLILTDKKVHTLPVAMSLFQGTYSNQMDLLLAGLVMSIIPIIILYVVLQKYIIAGVVAGAVKS